MNDKVYVTSMVGGTVVAMRKTWPRKGAKLPIDKEVLREVDENEFYENKFVKTEMITGSQYEALMAHLSKTSDKDKINSYLVGNKTNRLSFSGKYNDDLMYNIYDLASNDLSLYKR